MSTQEKGKHGGTRPGAGRKPKDNKKVQMTVTVTKETRDTLKTMAEEQNSRPGAIIDKMLENPDTFTPEGLVEWMCSLSCKEDGFLKESKWIWGNPICEDGILRPAVYWTDGMWSRYSGNDRLGLQLDKSLRLHIVYVYNKEDIIYDAVMMELLPEQIFVYPKEITKSLIISAVKRVFNQRKL